MCRTKLVLNVLAVCAAAACSDATKLPSYIKPCAKDQPTEALSACILQNARAAQSYFVQGVPELNIEPMDPLKLDDFKASAGTFTLREKNALLKGLKKMEIREMKWDLEKSVGLMRIFGNLTLTSDYEADGRVLIIPITGTGKMTVKMFDTEILLKYKIRRVKGPEGDHLETYDLKASQTYGGVKLHLSNILGGSIIGDTVNQVLNDNWRELFKEVGPPHTRSISQKVHVLINKLYAQVPYDELMV